MSFRKLLLAGAALAASSAAVAPANASIVDRPHFKVLGVVIVWASDNSTGGLTPIATDFIIDDNAAGGNSDLIGGTGVVDGRTVVTGSLTPTADSSTSVGLDAVLDISDAGTVFEFVDLNSPSTFSAFDVTDASISGSALEYNSSFYVASNTAFSINGAASTTNASGDFTLADIGYNLDVTVSGTDSGLDFGTNAQNPNGSFPAVANLGAMTSATPVFVGADRTAATAGSIVDQSVRFDATYTLGAGGAYDLSQGAGEIEAAVVYTVFVP